MTPSFVRKLWREPLLHFAVLGADTFDDAALFLAYLALGRPHDADAGFIVVGRGQFERLQAGFARAHQRAPSKQELDDWRMARAAQVRLGSASGHRGAAVARAHAGIG